MKVSVLAIAILASSATAFVPMSPTKPSWGSATEMMAKKKKKKNKNAGGDGSVAGELLLMIFGVCFGVRLAHVRCLY